MSQSVPETSSKLSAADRLILIQTLNALPSAQFEELLVALNPPKGNIPTNTAAQAIRSKALFEWIESPIGPGIPELETVLGMIISKQSQTAPEFLSFAISGTIHSKTVAEVRAIVELLRKKTGDDSIDVAFFKEGSINMILSGSPEGLKRLQELFESGELKNLDNSPVESIHHIDTTSADARKGRLVATLRLQSNSTLTINLVNDLDRALAIASELALISDIDLASDPARIRRRAKALVNNLTNVLNRARILDRARIVILDRVLDRVRVRASSLARVLDRDIKIARLHSIIRDLASGLASDRDLVDDLALALNRKLDLKGADFSNTNLRNIDFRNANLAEVDFSRADIARANLTGTDLTGAKLTEANVTETVFGENSGLTESDKRDLQQRGAIFQEPPSSDVPSLVPV